MQEDPEDRKTMKLAVAVIAMLGLTTAASAQPPGPEAVAATKPAAGLPPIGLPLAPIGLPLPRLGLTGAAALQPGSDHREGSFAPARPRVPSIDRGFVVPAVLFAAPYWPGMYHQVQPAAVAPAPIPADTPPAVPPEPVPASAPSGLLRLDLLSDVAVQIYVDGYFVGMAGDTGGELELEAGAHAIELRAGGHEPLVFRVRIEAGRSTTYKGALKPTSAPASPAPAPPSTMYLIPGCYLGNVHPQELTQPVDCDLRQLITLEPPAPR